MEIKEFAYSINFIKNHKRTQVDSFKLKAGTTNKTLEKILRKKYPDAKMFDIGSSVIDIIF